MINRMLAINEVDVTPEPVVYTCYGLGSCIGLFVMDRPRKLSGGAHIPLPAPFETNQYRDALQMMNELLDRFKDAGSDLTHLRAKIVGGSKVYESSFNIGQQNRHVVLHYMIEKKIFVAATDLGGSMARTARFNSLTEALEISTSEPKMYFI